MAVSSVRDPLLAAVGSKRRSAPPFPRLPVRTGRPREHREADWGRGGGLHSPRREHFSEDGPAVVYCELEVNDDALPLVGQGDHTGSCRKQTSSGEFDGPANLVVPKLGQRRQPSSRRAVRLVGMWEVCHIRTRMATENVPECPRMSSVWLGLLTAHTAGPHQEDSECHHPSTRPLMQVPEHRPWTTVRVLRRLVAEKRIPFHKMGASCSSTWQTWTPMPRRAA